MMQVAEADELMSSTAPFCFTVITGSRSLVLSASCPEEKLLWMDELQSAIRAARHRGESESSIILYPTLKSNSKPAFTFDTSTSLAIRVPTVPVIVNISLYVFQWQSFTLVWILFKTFKALNGLLCADVLLRNYSLTHSMNSARVCFFTHTSCFCAGFVFRQPILVSM